MNYRYKLLPALKDPIKFLKNVPAKHASELYLSNYYSPKDLAANPFAHELKSTRSDVSRIRFPIGNMIQVIVENEEGSLWLNPVLQKPVEGQNPAKYVINSKRYLEFQLRRNFKPIPLQYLARSPMLVPKIDVQPDFIRKAEKMYTERIKALLLSTATNGSNDRNEMGLLLRPGTSTRMKWRDGVLEITTELIEKEAFAAYRTNPELVHIFVLLANFNNVYK